MLSKKIEDLLNNQFNMELYSANLYLSICSYFLANDLEGFANFFRIQALEEQMHAMKQFDYIHQIDGKIKMQKVDKPITEFKSIIHTFEITYAHEKLVSKSVSSIVEQSLKEKDFATHTFFQWFVTEQVEEEASIKTLLKKLEMIGDNSSALYLLNDELGKRTFTAPKNA
jgi:ferritin